MASEGLLASLAKALLPPEPDPRIAAYPLMQTWTPTALIALTYTVVCYRWRAELLKRSKLNGHQKGRASSDGTGSWSFTKYLMILYNAVMVVYSAYMVIGTVVAVRRLGYGLGCVEQPDPNDRSTDILLHLGYLFYFSKFVELLDTVFFLLRGKVDQVTFLHVFHHAAMPPSIWWGLKYSPGGIVYTFIVANSLIHTAMYTYYGLAAAGLYKYLWWKNYLTVGQMIQFIFLIIHQGQVFVRSTPCNYPKVFPAAVVCYSLVFFVLFANFYVKAYWRGQRLAKRAKDDDKHAKANHANGNVVANGFAVNGDAKVHKKRA